MELNHRGPAYETGLKTASPLRERIAPLGDDYPMRSNLHSPLSHISSWFEMRGHFRLMLLAAACVKREDGRQGKNRTFNGQSQRIYRPPPRAMGTSCRKW